MLATTRTDRIAQQTAAPADDWQSVLAAMADLKSVDVELFKQAAKAVANELAEMQRAYEAVSAKLGLAQQHQAKIDARFAELLGAAALLRKTLDTDSNFAGLYGDDAEAAIQHVRSLRQLAE